MMREKQRYSEKVLRLLGIGLLSLALIGWNPAASGKEELQQPQIQNQAAQGAEQGESEEQAQLQQESPEQGRDDAPQQEKIVPFKVITEQPLPEADPSQEARKYNETHFLTSGALIGFKVTNQQGDEVGKIYDILVDGQEKTAPMVVVSFGGLLGIGDRLYAVPWTEVRHEHEADSCVLSVPKEPESIATARPDWIALEETYSEGEPKFGQGPYGLKKADEGEVPTAPPGASHLVSANELLKTKLSGSDSKEEIGNLDNFILGSEMGHLVCGIVSLEVSSDDLSTSGEIPSAIDPQLGVIDAPKYMDVAIPITLMDLDTEGKMFTTKVSGQTIEDAPDFRITQKEEKKGLDRAWIERVYEYFNEDLNQLGGVEEAITTDSSSIPL